MQRSRAGAQVDLVADERIRVAAERHIELVRAIHAVEAVEAGLVQVDEPGRAVRVFKRFWIHRTHAQVVLFFVWHRAQKIDDRFDVGLDRPVGADQAGVHVGKRCGPAEREEERTAPDERLVIRVVGLRHPREQFGDE